MVSEGVCVNRIGFKIDTDAFDRTFVLLRTVKLYGEHVGRTFKSLDGFRECIRAIKYSYGADSYIMCDRKALSDGKIDLDSVMSVIAEEYRESGKEKGYSNAQPREVKIVSSKTVDDTVLLDLLNISLSHSKYPADDFGCSNLEGTLYVSDTLPKPTADRFTQLNIKYTEAKDLTDLFGDTKVEFNARSFTNMKHKDSMKGQGKYTCPRYAIVGDSLQMVWNQKGVRENRTFIQHGCRNLPKADMQFFSIGSLASLDNSKMGLLRRTMRRLKDRYPDILTEFGFVRTDLFDGDDCRFYRKSSLDTGFPDYLKKLCSEREFHLIDMVRNEESKKVCDLLRDGFGSELGMDLILSDDVIADAHNFVLLSDMEDDQYRRYSDKAVQHVLVDSITPYFDKGKAKDEEEGGGDGIHSTGLKSMLRVMAIDVMIKHDLVSGENTFFDWMAENIMGEYTTDRTWHFMSRPRVMNNDPDPKKRKKNVYGNMASVSLFPDGHISARIYTHDEISDDAVLHTCWTSFDKDNNTRGIITDGESVYAIGKTDITMIPEIEQAREKLRTNPDKVGKDGTVKKSLEGLRTKDGIKRFFKACTDVYRFNGPDLTTYYYVGVRGEGMKTKIARAANIHKITTLVGEDQVPDLVFRMMLAPFVILQRMSTRPYVFKMVDEFMQMNGMDSYSYEDPDDEKGTEVYHQQIIEDYVD